MFKIIIGVIIATIILIVVFTQVDPNVTESVISNNSNSTSLNDGTISVTITGEVVHTGTYYIKEKSTLDDLCSVAGGLTSNSDDLAYDLTYILEANQAFYIAPKYDVSDACTYDPITKVNINLDEKETLMSINGFGSTIASAIVTYRASKSFKRIEDLKNVTGIGNATFEKVKNYITLK